MINVLIGIIGVLICVVIVLSLCLTHVLYYTKYYKQKQEDYLKDLHNLRSACYDFNSSASWLIGDLWTCFEHKRRVKKSIIQKFVRHHVNFSNKI